MGIKETDDNVGNVVRLAIKVVIGLIAIILLFSVLFGSWYTVKEGDVGVMFHKFGAKQGFDSEVIQQGWGFKMPFRDRLYTIPFRTQTIAFYGGGDKGSYSSINPKDKNGITYTLDMTLRYRLDPTQASAFVEQKGEGITAMESILSTAARADSTRGVLGQYAQEDVPTLRDELSLEVKNVLQKRIDQEGSGKLKPGFIVIEAVDLRNVIFNDQIESAIVNKQTAKQTAERKEYELQQANKEKEITIVNANRDKEAKILIAEGEARSIFLVAEAKAKGIQLVNDAYQSMPSQYVAVKFAEAIQPTDKMIFGLDSLGGNNLNLLDINKLVAARTVTANNETQ